MKTKGLYVVLSLYSLTRWFTEYFEDNYDLFDANVLYFIFDGTIICTVGGFLYGNSKKDYVAKASLFLMVALGLSQAASFLSSYYYNQYIECYLPIFVVAVTLLEIYRFIDRKFIEITEDNTE
jgi:hypothetical protein